MTAAVLVPCSLSTLLLVTYNLEEDKQICITQSLSTISSTICEEGGLDLLLSTTSR